MAEPNYTKGNWEAGVVKPAFVNARIEINTKEHPDPICVIDCRDKEAQANAQLISKAPRMYELLQQIRREMLSDGAILNEASTGRPRHLSSDSELELLLLTNEAEKGDNNE